MRIEVVRHDWPRFGEVLDLYYRELYGPFGVAPNTEWYHPASGSTLVVALDDDGGLLGSARLLPFPGEVERQVRQVVVTPEARGQGIGRGLMQAIERVAAEQGARELWLNARESAYGFYSALGWEFAGETFESELTGVPHREMRKRVGG